MYLKFNDGRIYVYRSFTDQQGTQSDIYVSNYREYRKAHPEGTFVDLLGEKTLTRWIMLYPERIDTLIRIDNEVQNHEQIRETRH